MERIEVLLSFGSNVGDREGYILKAIEKLRENPNLKLIKCSSLFNNKAILFEDQPDFLNAVAVFDTSLNPFKLLQLCQRTEKELGRIVRFDKGPREIDIDILTFGKAKIVNDKLILPHPGILNREYLKILLQEIGYWESLVQENNF